MKSLYIGYGGLGSYGGSITRGDATLWIDKLATGYSTWNFARLFAEGHLGPLSSGKPAIHAKPKTNKTKVL